MSVDTESFRAGFFEECDDLLEALQDGLSLLLARQETEDTIHAVFRAVHSIKGGAGAFRLDALVDFAHRFETLLDRLRSATAPPELATLALCQRAGDHLADLVAAARTDGDSPAPEVSAQLQALLDASIVAAPAHPQPGEAPGGATFMPLVLDLDLAVAPATPSADAFSPPHGQGTPAIAAPAPPVPHDDTTHPPPAAAELPPHRVRLVPRTGFYEAGHDPGILIAALAELGPIDTRLDAAALPPLDRAEPEASHLAWDIRADPAIPEPALREVFEFVEGLCTLEIVIAQPGPPDATADPRHRAPQGSGMAASPQGLHPGQRRPAEPSSGREYPTAQTEAAPQEVSAAPPPRTASAADRSSAPETEGHIHSPPDAPASEPAPAFFDRRRLAREGGTQSIRVDLDRVDRLINLVGELVIKEAMLSQSIARAGLPRESDVVAGLEGLKQLAGEIQEGVMAIRAQPLKPLFQRMSRILREAGEATGKQVRLVMQGEQTEVDKTVIERLVDPLTHMLRNAVDHGLETPAARRAAGKPEEGSVILSAAHRSGRVLIEVCDDGGGIDRMTVLARARARGLVPEHAELTPAEIDALLFLPGFSSREEVSALSGRGVGLDVVRREIQALGGRVTIASEPGCGTSFSISLPLTLAVLEGMVVDLAGQTLVIPIGAVQETLQPSGLRLHPLGGGAQVLHNRGGILPVVDLGATFGFRPALSSPEGRVLVVLETDANRRCALLVDGIHDQRQVVIKSLEDNFARIEGIAAATILGDGRIALIVDPDALLTAAPPGFDAVA
ncbi:MAG: chemotaxis protein CheA [Rhodobacteraceae bacterium]|nr:chemotaxis protein CheA [Paracoccaceae bacterium]